MYSRLGTVCRTRASVGIAADNWPDVDGKTAPQMTHTKKTELAKPASDRELDILQSVQALLAELPAAHWGSILGTR